MGSRLFVGGLSVRTTERDLEDLFAKCGRVVGCDFKSRPDSSFAFIEFSNADDADEAIRKYDGFDFDGSRLLVEVARSKQRNFSLNSSGRDSSYREGSYRDSRGDSRDGNYRDSRVKERRLIVDNLPSQFSWQDLKDFGRTAGPVTYANVFSDRGITRGVVEYETVDDMRAAVRRLDGKNVDGYEISVQEELSSSGSRRDRSRSPPPRSSRRDDYSSRGSYGGSRYSERSSYHRRRSPSPRSDRYAMDEDDRRGRRKSLSRSRSRSPVKPAYKSPSRSPQD